jgi:hypothetical protein
MQYFNFRKLEQYMEIFDAIWISLAVFFIVWTLASLYYWSTEDLRLRHSDAPKNHKK